MKNIKKFKSMDEMIGYTAKTPFVGIVEGYSENNNVFIANITKGDSVTITESDVEDWRPDDYGEAIYIYKTRAEYGLEMDEEYFQYDGTTTIDGETLYKWAKKKDSYNPEFINHTWILTDTRDFSNVSAEKPYKIVGQIYDDVHDNTVYMGDFDDYIVYGGTELVENRIMNLPHHDTSNLNANGKEYVDLGLPSGTLWAKYNVGATNEYDYGGLYQWGGTVDMTNSSCDWNTYPYGSGWDQLTKYNASDNKTVLDLEDDAAHVNMGGDWKMPTALQINELILNTTIQYNVTINGIKGTKFINKSDSSKYIFIPFNGYRVDSEFRLREATIHVWSISLSVNYLSDAFYLYSGSYGESVSVVSRFCGLSARGVLY